MSKESDEEQKARPERRDLLATLCKDRKIDEIRTLYSGPPLGTSTPPCPWNKTDPRDAGGNRDIIIFGGTYVTLVRVEIEEGWVIERCDTTDEILWVIAGEWPANFRWIELPKEDEE